MAKKKHPIYAVVEIGSTHIRTLLAELDGQPESLSSPVRALAAEEVRSLSVTRGEIHNMNIVAEQIANCMQKAEQAIGGREIDHYHLVFSSPKLRSVEAAGCVMVSGQDSVVSAEDIREMKDACLLRCRRPNSVSLVDFPKSFLVDDREVANPEGQVGVQLSGLWTVLQTDASTVETFRRAPALALSREPHSLWPSPMTALNACAEASEIKEGCLVLDVGFGMVNYAVTRGEIAHLGVFPFGTRYIYADLADCFGLKEETAQRIFTECGSLSVKRDGRERMIRIHCTVGMPDRMVPLSSIEEVAHARAEEIIRHIWHDVSEHCANARPRRVILCGGGARIKGLRNLVHEITGLPVRDGLALPQRVILPATRQNDPTWVNAAAGLILARTAHTVDRARPAGLMQDLKLECSRIADQALRWVKQPFEEFRF